MQLFLSVFFVKLVYYKHQTRSNMAAECTKAFVISLIFNSLGIENIIEGFISSPMDLLLYLQNLNVELYRSRKSVM